MQRSIECPACSREIGFGEEMMDMRNCPYCIAPVEVVEDTDGICYLALTNEAYR